MVVGLSKLIKSDSSSFTVETSTSPFIVLHPVELLFSTLNAYVGEVNNVYGVDLIRGKILYEETLKKAASFGIRPVFTYNGLRERSYVDLQHIAKINSLLRKNYDAKELDVPSSEFNMGSDFFPASRTFSVNCLQNLGFPCVSAGYDWMPSCLGIALILDCPIAAMSSDYYICSRPISIPESLKSLTINELKYVNLRDKFYSVKSEGGRDRVVLNVYRPENSPLKSVPPASRTLIALLMNQYIIPKLPDVIKIEPRDEELYNDAKLRSVIDYVSKTNPIHVLKEVMELCADSGRADYVSKMILSYLELFCPDFAEASKLLSILGLNQGLPTIEPPPSRKKKLQGQENLSPSVFFEKAAKLLKGSGHEDTPFDFFYRWPKALIHLYRSGHLEKVYIAPLYDKLGVIFSASNEYLTELPHCFGPARVLRIMLYSLLAGVDEANGARFKLVGLKPNVRELCYEGLFSYKTYNVHIQPMYLPANCSTDDFLHTVLGFNCAPDIPEWSVALVVSCLLWHQQKPQHKNCQIRECPLILSTLLLALITHHTPECDLPALADHLDELKTVVKTELTQNNALPSSALEKEFLHGALELTILYNNYITLSNLLTVLQNPNVVPDFKSPVYDRFPQIHIAFPSLELLVGIACHLKTQEFPYNVTLRMWLVRAFRPMVNNISAVKALQQVVATFASLMQRISTMKLVFQEPKVDTSDPPNCFLSKEERTSKRVSSFRENRAHFEPCGISAAKSPPDSHPRTNLNKSQTPSSSKGGGRRQKKLGSYADRLTKRLEEMELNTS
ncbi:hypothetical protein ACTXT7_004907 [Hymenolepis weldensis]